MMAARRRDALGGLAVVDVGNARMKWARVVDGRLVGSGSAPHARGLDAAFEALAASLPERLSRLVAANVAGPSAASRLAELVHERYGLDPEFIAPETETLGVRCGYRDPSRLGADRWAAVVAAHALARASAPVRPACVINAGSAYTFDAVDASGQHLGGLILAGPRIAADALARNTRRIGPTEPVQRIPHGLELLGKSTDEAVGHGALLGPAAAFDRAVAVLDRSLGARPVVYVAGGDGPLLASWLETQVQLRADLVLEGVALIAAGSERRVPLPTE